MIRTTCKHAHAKLRLFCTYSPCLFIRQRSLEKKVENYTLIANNNEVRFLYQLPEFTDRALYLENILVYNPLILEYPILQLSNSTKL